MFQNFLDAVPAPESAYPQNFLQSLGQKVPVDGDRFQGHRVGMVVQPPAHGSQGPDTMGAGRGPDGEGIVSPYWSKNPRGLAENALKCLEGGRKVLSEFLWV